MKESVDLYQHHVYPFDSGSAETKKLMFCVINPPVMTDRTSHIGRSPTLEQTEPIEPRVSSCQELQVFFILFYSTFTEPSVE